ncbi:MAG: hypothetical protein KDE14_15765 [Rhodobacteraceae bacterium]|nr:hypothetical protein [Paracoccaceae bacterium]
MRDITVIGAGQSGLILGMGLLRAGYKVRLVTNKRPGEIRSGRILSNQCMWGEALGIERGLGLALWDETAPPIPGFDTRYVPDTKIENQLKFYAPLAIPGQSVDQRLKFSTWMERFEKLGGEISVQFVKSTDLAAFAKDCDLLVMAAGKGKGDLRSLFVRDEARSPFDKPARIGASIHVRNRIPDDSNNPEREIWMVIPGVGEFWIVPTLTVHGPGHILCLQSVPGSPMDIWENVESPEQHRELILRLIKEWMPDEFERSKNVELVDNLSYLSGGIVSAVHNPIIELPNGRPCLSVGDAMVLNDPISQQGSNIATRSAKILLDSILARKGEAFDRAWMVGTANRIWHAIRWTVRMTEIYLNAPQNYLSLFERAAASGDQAKFLADTNNFPESFVRAVDSDDRRAYPDDLIAPNSAAA